MAPSHAAYAWSFVAVASAAATPSQIPRRTVKPRLTTRARTSTPSAVQNRTGTSRLPVRPRYTIGPTRHTISAVATPVRRSHTVLAAAYADTTTPTAMATVTPRPIRLRSRIASTGSARP